MFDVVAALAMATSQCGNDVGCHGYKPPVMGAAPAAVDALLHKLIVSALVTWVFELCIGHVLEFVKIAKQTSDKSYPRIFHDITTEKGVLGMWDGFFPWGSVQALLKGAVFGLTAAAVKDQLSPLVAKGTLQKRTAEVLAGSIGGGFQGLVLSPTLLLKTRVMTDPVFRQRMSFWETNVQSARIGARVIRQEGFQAVMKGSGVFSSKRVFDWATRYYFAECVESALRDVKGGMPLSTPERILASLIGGCLSAFVTLPMDVATAQIQQASKAGQKVSVLELFAAQARSGGLQHMMEFASRGFTARMLHVALTTVAMKTLTPLVSEALFAAK